MQGYWCGVGWSFAGWSLVNRLRVDWLWEGCQETRRCSRDTFPGSSITKYTSIRRLESKVEDVAFESGLGEKQNTVQGLRCSLKGVGVRVGFENNCFTEMCSGSEEGSYLRLIDLCINQL